MKCYLDSSAVLKLILEEPESADFRAVVEAFHADGVTFVTSVLTGVEVARALRRCVVNGRLSPADLQAGWETALKGVMMAAISPAMLDEAKIVGNDELRSLDAIHLATAHVVHADVVFTYDERLIQACMEAGVMTARPGVSDVKLPPGWGWIINDDDWPDDANLPPGW